MNKKGFTLIELLVVVSILGVLAAISFPLYIGYQKGAARQEATANLQGLSLCLEQTIAETNSYGAGGADTAALTAAYTCFQPHRVGGGANLNFNYSLTVNNPARTFTATATGLTGTRVAGEVLTINQQGVKGGNWPN